MTAYQQQEWKASIHLWSLITAASMYLAYLDFPAEEEDIADNACPLQLYYLLAKHV